MAKKESTGIRLAKPKKKGKAKKHENKHNDYKPYNRQG